MFDKLFKLESNSIRLLNEVNINEWFIGQIRFITFQTESVCIKPIGNASALKFDRCTRVNWNEKKVAAAPATSLLLLFFVSQPVC